MYFGDKVTLQELNDVSPDDAISAFLRCCGSTRWVRLMEQRRPFRDRTELFDAAEKIWRTLGPDDWKEAFSHHPRIGSVGSLRTKFPDTAAWAEGEQSGTRKASEETLHQLAEANEAYEQKFGRIFIVCATGKSAEEMLALMKSRLPNDPDSELGVAAAEQLKITRIRLEKLLQE